MHETIATLLRHGYLVLFGSVLLEQLGVPLPSFPILLGAGALAGSGRLNFLTVLLVAFLAAATSDAFWFSFGIWRGTEVLRRICKISLNPDSCVRGTEDAYDKYGEKSLLVAKFIPGLGTVTPPLAGASGMPWYRFLLFDGLGVLIWTLSFISVGYVFASQIEDVAEYAMRLGQILIVLVAGAMAAYLGYKYARRWRFLRQLRTDRITPLELKRMLDAGERVQIIDLRHPIEVRATPLTVPGAIHVDPQKIESVVSRVSPDQDVVLYCT